MVFKGLTEVESRWRSLSRAAGMSSGWVHIQTDPIRLAQTSKWLPALTLDWSDCLEFFGYIRLVSYMFLYGLFVVECQAPSCRQCATMSS
eukprot:2539388-Amphidinium_carterae.2